MSLVSSIITLAAQGLPILCAVAAVVVWLTLPLTDKKRLAVTAVIAGALATVLILATGAVHNDPRPFVVDPGSPAFFPHPADNGFPSDHTTYAAGAALLVATVRLRLGIVLVALAILGGLARVAANVHHLQDIAAGLLLALVSVWAATTIVSWAHRWRLARTGKVGVPQE